MNLHTQSDNVGPEEIYGVMAVEARLVAKYRDNRMRRFFCEFFTTNNIQPIVNVGTARCESGRGAPAACGRPS